MTDEKGPNKKSPLRSREVLSIGLAGIASSLGYLALVAVIISYVVTAIYGDHSVNPRVLWVSHWLSVVWYYSTFFAIITVPMSLALALVATFLPLAKRAKIIIWLIAVGGGLGWLIAARVVLGPTL